MKQEVRRSSLGLLTDEDDAKSEAVRGEMYQKNLSQSVKVGRINSENKKEKPAEVLCWRLLVNEERNDLFWTLEEQIRTLTEEQKKKNPRLRGLTRQQTCR